jgi:hypothetical protein
MAPVSRRDRVAPLSPTPARSGPVPRTRDHTSLLHTRRVSRFRRGLNVAGGSFGKREREKQQRERAAAKRQRRLDHADHAVQERPDTESLMERFRVLSEAYASGATDRSSYEAERSEIFVALGVNDEFDDSH